MSVFRSLVFTAAAAGLVVGLAVTALQQVGTVPLIIRAEVYEKQAEAARAAHAVPSVAVSAPDAPVAAAPAATPVPHDHAGHQHGTAAAAASDTGHGHEAAAWEPADGLERHLYTALFNVVEWIGFGLCLAGLLVLFGREAGWREGLLWGLAGFAAMVLAPGLGLPPELPGVPAADLVPRQAWWVATAAATAGGIALIAFGRGGLPVLAGILLLVAPHVVGAPQLDHVETNVPDALSRQFITIVTVTTFLSWALLGALTGFFLNRFAGEPRRA